MYISTYLLKNSKHLNIQNKEILDEQPLSLLVTRYPHSLLFFEVLLLYHFGSLLGCSVHCSVCHFLEKQGSYTSIAPLWKQRERERERERRAGEREKAYTTCLFAVSPFKVPATFSLDSEESIEN